MFVNQVKSKLLRENCSRILTLTALLLQKVKGENRAYRSESISLKWLNEKISLNIIRVTILKIVTAISTNSTSLKESSYK